MSEEERKFLEIVDLKKGFGSGETRQEVLRGMNFSVARVSTVCCSGRQAPESLHCSISSEASTAPIPDISA